MSSIVGGGGPDAFMSYRAVVLARYGARGLLRALPSLLEEPFERFDPERLETGVLVEGELSQGLRHFRSDVDEDALSPLTRSWDASRRICASRLPRVPEGRLQPRAGRHLRSRIRRHRGFRGAAASPRERFRRRSPISWRRPDRGALRVPGVPAGAVLPPARAAGLCSFPPCHCFRGFPLFVMREGFQCPFHDSCCGLRKAWRFVPRRLIPYGVQRSCAEVHDRGPVPRGPAGRRHRT